MKIFKKTIYIFILSLLLANSVMMSIIYPKSIKIAQARPGEADDVYDGGYSVYLNYDVYYGYASQINISKKNNGKKIVIKNKEKFIHLSSDLYWENDEMKINDFYNQSHEIKKRKLKFKLDEECMYSSFDVDDDIRFTGEAIKYKNIKQGIKEAHQGKVEGGIFIYVYKNKVLRISSMSS